MNYKTIKIPIWTLTWCWISLKVIFFTCSHFFYAFEFTVVLSTFFPVSELLLGLPAASLFFLLPVCFFFSLSLGVSVSSSAGRSPLRMSYKSSLTYCNIDPVTFLNTADRLYLRLIIFSSISCIKILCMISVFRLFSKKKKNIYKVNRKLWPNIELTNAQIRFSATSLCRMFPLLAVPSSSFSFLSAFYFPSTPAKERNQRNKSFTVFSSARRSSSLSSVGIVQQKGIFFIYTGANDILSQTWKGSRHQGVGMEIQPTTVMFRLPSEITQHICNTRNALQTAH